MGVSLEVNWQIKINVLRARLKAFSRSATAASLLRAGRYLFMVSIFGLLVYQFTSIGWQEIWHSLPVTPVFYLIFLVIYLALPVSETFIYRTAWQYSFFSGFTAFLKKRVYNKDILGYSGELYLYLWARKHIGLREREILGTVKDNAIISSVASTLFAVVVLAVLFFTKQIALDGIFQADHVGYMVAAILLTIILTGVGVKFRRAIFRLPGRTLSFIFGVHVIRLGMTSLLQVCQWAVVLPDISIRVWLTFLAVQIVTSRIPVLPSRDLIFLGVSVELSRMLDISSASVAGMMLVTSVLDKVLNFVFFSLLALFGQDRPPNAIITAPTPRPSGLPDYELKSEAISAPVSESRA